MFVSPKDIYPSQDFLKPDTVKFILECIDKDELEKIPPVPIVRKGENGELVAIDGHNLIAVMYVLDEEIDVHVAESARDGIEEVEEADKIRNQRLKEKFDTVLDDRKVTISRGKHTFGDLVARYPGLFGGLV